MKKSLQRSQFAFLRRGDERIQQEALLMRVHSAAASLRDVLPRAPWEPIFLTGSPAAAALPNIR